MQYAKLLVIAKLAELMPRTQGKRTDLTSPGGQEKLQLARDTATTYRKIGDNAAQIDDYREKVEENNLAVAEDSPDVVEMSAAGFLRFVGSDGDIKSNQNKGV